MMFDMRSTKVVNRNTGTIIEVDVLSQSRFSIRLVAKGTTIPFTLHRDRELQRYGGVVNDMPLETLDAVRLGRDPP